MYRTVIASAIALTFLAVPVQAGNEKVVSYSIYKKKTEVKGAFRVDGFTYKQIISFISKDCAGKVGQIALTGKPRKKKGNLVQKFTTTCTGGPNPNKYKGTVASITVVEPRGGKRFAQVFASDGAGNMVSYEEAR